MDENRRRILEMVAQGKISVDEAEKLLSLLEQPEEAPPGPSSPPSARARPIRQAPFGSAQGRPSHLRVVVQPEPDSPTDDSRLERVDVRVPLSVIRAGMKLPALLPQGALAGINEALRKKGLDIDIRNLDSEEIEEVIEALSAIEIDVRDGAQKVRIYTE
ncbi:MAG: hypothetical protein L0177_12570 [Chloroflexi bacterium]|nr:hypothetical protein [Chloroflexota bacterium]